MTGWTGGLAKTGLMPCTTSAVNKTNSFMRFILDPVHVDIQSDKLDYLKKSQADLMRIRLVRNSKIIHLGAFTYDVRWAILTYLPTLIRYFTK